MKSSQPTIPHPLFHLPNIQPAILVGIEHLKHLDNLFLSDLIVDGLDHQAELGEGEVVVLVGVRSGEELLEGCFTGLEVLRKAGDVPFCPGDALLHLY